MVDSLVGGRGRVAVTGGSSSEDLSEGMAKQIYEMLRELLSKVTKLEKDYELTNEKTNRLDDGFKAFLEGKLQEDRERAETRGFSSASSSGSSSSSSGLASQVGGGEMLVASAGGGTTLESTPKGGRAWVMTRLGEALVNWTTADRERTSSDNERRVYCMNAEGNLSLNTKNCEANLIDTLRIRRCADIKIMKACSRASAILDHAPVKRMYEMNMIEA